MIKETLIQKLGREFDPFNDLDRYDFSSDQPQFSIYALGLIKSALRGMIVGSTIWAAATIMNGYFDLEDIKDNAQQGASLVAFFDASQYYLRFYLAKQN